MEHAPDDNQDQDDDQAQTAMVQSAWPWVSRFDLAKFKSAAIDLHVSAGKIFRQHSRSGSTVLFSDALLVQCLRGCSDPDRHANLKAWLEHWEHNCD